MSLFKLRYQQLDLELKHAFTISRGTRHKVANVFVELESNGISGYGEAAPNARYNEDADSVIHFLEALPKDLFDNIHSAEELAARLDARPNPVQSAKCAVEMAWLDWHAKKQGKPLWRLWDAPSARGPQTSFTIGLDTLEVIQQKVREAEAWPILKVKLGTGRDREIITAIREITDKPVRVDANEGWTSLNQAMEMLEFLAGQNIELVEQPMPAARLDDMIQLKQQSPLPLCADESFEGNEPLEKIAEAFDIINIKLMKIGSMVKARQVIQQAKAFGLQVMIGCMIESSVANTAGAVLSLWADYADLDGHMLIKNDTAKGLQLDDEKRIILPEGPGLGVLNFR